MRCARADGDGPGPLTRVRTPAYTYVSRCAPRSTQLSVTDTIYTVTVCTRVSRNSYSMVFELLLLRVLYEYTCLS